MKKNHFSALLFLAFLASLFAFPLVMMSEDVPNIVASDEDDDDVDGIIESQNFNNRATVGQFQLLYTSGSAVENFAQIDPQTTYKVELTVNDPDTVRDLESLEVRFFNSSVSGTSVTPGEVTTDFNAATQTGTDGQEFVVKWTADGSDSTVEPFVLKTDGNPNTWTMTSVSTPTSNDMNDTSFKFEFEFQISKVAPYFADQSVVWYFGAIIEDGRISLDDNASETPISLSALTASAVEGNAYDLNGASSWKVNWYGEISVSDTAISWTNLPAGVTFGAAVANTSIGGIKLLSNGQYDSQIRNKQAHWNAIMTTTLAETVFERFDSTDFGNFRSSYNASAAALQDAPYNFDIPLSLNDIDTNNTYAALNTLPYEVINIIADQVGNIGNWANFEYNLQNPFAGVNTTGATMIATSSEFDDLLDTDDSSGEYQAFAIGFVTYGAISQGGVQVTVDGNEYYLVATSDTYNNNAVPFHSFSDEDGQITKLKTNESGDEAHLDLYIALSRIYQNARYEGVLQLKIANPLSD